MKKVCRVPAAGARRHQCDSRGSMRQELRRPQSTEVLDCFTEDLPRFLLTFPDWR